MSNFVFLLPDYLKNHEQEITNFGLKFQKFFPYVNNNLDTTGTDENKKTVESLQRLCQADTGKNEILNLLRKKNESQNKLLEQRVSLGTDIMKIRARLASRLITGIGEPTPAEVGMVFDRNLGIPYIPAPSIKGAVAYAYCINYVNEAAWDDPYVSEQGTGFNPDEPGFKLLFGARDSKEASRGGFAFMDAYPESRPEIVTDIMNPHFGGYYRGENPPSETENPIPIKFLAVEKGLAFNFRGYFINKGAQAYSTALFNAFQTALGILGLGAKTAAGYGLFEAVENQSGQVKANIQKRIEQERAEKRALEEKEREARLKEKKQQIEEQERRLREEADKAYEEAVETATGIEKDILLLERGDLQMAFGIYEKYLKDKKTLEDPAEIRLTRLIEKHFENILVVKGKKASKDKKGMKKYEKRLHVEKLIASVK